LGVNDLSRELGISASAVSQHLRVLKHARLVSNERKGYFIPYEVDPFALAECRGIISQVCQCGCRGLGRKREGRGSPDKATRLAHLKRLQREISKELKEVSQMIAELEIGD
jgi:predicted transcriptional regulator